MQLKQKLLNLLEAVFYGHIEMTYNFEWTRLKINGLLKIYFWVIALFVFLIFKFL